MYPPKQPHPLDPRYNLETYIGAAAAGLVLAILSIVVYYGMKIALVFDVFQAQWFGHLATVFDIITWAGGLAALLGFGKLARSRRKNQELQRLLGKEHEWRVTE